LNPGDFKRSKVLENFLRVVGKNIFDVQIESNKINLDKNGNKVSYVVNRNINFTNRCEVNCSFCAFSRSKKREKTLAMEEVSKKVENAKDGGATEICLQGGINPELDIDYYLKLLREINSKYDIHIHAFSPQEILHMSEGSVEKTLEKLKSAGLGSMPGTAAEILDDRIRKKICPNKLTSDQWETVISKAHKLGISTTATMMYGHLESWEERLIHLKKIKKIQEKHSGFTEFIPLPFLPGNNELGNITGSRRKGLEDLLVISLARIVLEGSIDNIQGSWVKLGKNMVSKSLYFGANDIGGTLMEENISSSTGKATRGYMRKEEMEKLIKNAGKVPVQRKTIY